ncbi:MAG: DUF3426 domain-containing protein [Desulfohalobiaceae bacterium]
MILSCPNCFTSFRLAMDRIAPGGSKLRCSRCGHIFKAGPLDGEAENSQERKLQQTLQDDTPFVEEKEQVSYNLEEKVSFKRPGTKFLWGLLILLVLLLAGAGYYFFPQWQHLLPGQEQAQEESPELEQRDMHQSQDLDDFALQDVRQYMVQNEQVGRILVVEGRVQNNSQKAKKMIRLEATLYDQENQELERTEFYCGNTVSLFQLQVLELEELESALESKVGILTHNSNVPPGQSVEFMHIFPNPSQELEEFSLQVVRAENAEDSSSDE